MIRRQYISGIKQRAIADVVVRTPNGRKYGIRGRSQFDYAEGEIGRRRLVTRAIFAGFYRAINKFTLPTGTRVQQATIIGYETTSKVTVRRVNVRGKYRTYVYAQGRKGMVKNVKWGYEKDLGQDILDETGVGAPDEWKQ